MASASAIDDKYPILDPNVIYLHLFPRSYTKQVPNLSGFGLKVETWLRNNGIKYEVIESTLADSPTKQIPFMQHRGKQIADSNLIIEYIEHEFGLDKTEGLQARDVGTSRAVISMVDESLGRIILLHRYCYNYKDYGRIADCGRIVNKHNEMTMEEFSEFIMQNMKAAGIGRKSQSDVYHIAVEDIRAISMLLGENTFIMANKITKVDCAVFGQLCQVQYVDYVYPHKEFMQKECPNLFPYLDRIKEKCWPDWDNIVDKGHFNV